MQRRGLRAGLVLGLVFSAFLVPVQAKLNLFGDKTGQQLVKAAEDGDVEAVRALCASGMNPNATGKYYDDAESALFAAIRRGHTEIMRVLITAGADVNAKVGKNKQTALMVRALCGPCEEAKVATRILLDAGVDINARDRKGYTALIYACERGHEVAEMLIAAGANVNLKTKKGLSALANLIECSSYHAYSQEAMLGHKKVLEALIAAGVDVNAIDGNGRTPLSLAKKYGASDEVIAILIKAGAKDKTKKVKALMKKALHPFALLH